MAEFRTFRDRSTGIVRDYPASLATVFPNLEEVEPGTKPLVYDLIPSWVKDPGLASASEPDEDASDDEEDEA